LAKPNYSTGGSFASDPVCTSNSAAFTSFAGIDNVSQSGSLCLLSAISDWDNTWIVDTGANDHMCNNKNLFANFKTLEKTSSVVLPNEKSVSISLAGSVQISPGLVLYGVLYVPSFKYNLLSVSKLSRQQNCYVVFAPRCCFMQAPSMKRPQVLGEAYAGLYMHKTTTANSATLLSNTNSHFPFSVLSQSVCNVSRQLTSFGMPDLAIYLSQNFIV